MLKSIMDKLFPASSALPPMPQAPPAPSQYSNTAGPYLTSLSPTEESEFRLWVSKNKVPFDSSPSADYDMRGFWKAQKNKDPRAAQALSGFDQSMHFPDVWKTPYHKTFSNESIYATPNAPKWSGDKLIDSSGRTLADETPKVK